LNIINDANGAYLAKNDTNNGYDHGIITHDEISI
jgi:hypothetical protein